MKPRNVIIVSLLCILATATVTHFISQHYQESDAENLNHLYQQEILQKQTIIDSLHILISQVSETIATTEQQRAIAERNLTNLKKQYEKERSRVIGLSNDEQLRLLTDNLSRICNN